MTEMAQTPARQSYVWGPLSLLGLMVALLAGVVDQVSKFWLLYGFDLDNRVRVAHSAVRRPRCHLEYRDQLWALSAA